jgi:hypothetical protein
MTRTCRFLGGREPYFSFHAAQARTVAVDPSAASPTQSSRRAPGVFSPFPGNRPVVLSTGMIVTSHRPLAIRAVSNSGRGDLERLYGAGPYVTGGHIFAFAGSTASRVQRRGVSEGSRLSRHRQEGRETRPAVTDPVWIGFPNASVGGRRLRRRRRDSTPSTATPDNKRTPTAVCDPPPRLTSPLAATSTAPNRLRRSHACVRLITQARPVVAARNSGAGRWR